MLGTQLQNYKIEKIIGEGGMAIVYLACNEKSGEKVAIKFLKEEFVQRPNIRKRFLAEARNLTQMNHPNVIKAIDTIDAGDIVGFVMEHIEGVTLEDFISNFSPLVDEVIEPILNQMIEAVNYVHSKGLIHRDIKPSNFMLSNNGSLKLLDFGIAKNLNKNAEDYTETNIAQQMGTPMYMSPEQIKNTSVVTKATDYYSLGVVLWQMVSNKKPYDTKTLTLPEIQVSILKEKLTLTNTIWDGFIQKATQKDETKRFQDAEELLITSNKKETKEIDLDETVFDEELILEQEKSKNFLKRDEILIYYSGFKNWLKENKSKFILYKDKSKVDTEKTVLDEKNNYKSEDVEIFSGFISFIILIVVCTLLMLGFIYFSYQNSETEISENDTTLEKPIEVNEENIKESKFIKIGEQIWEKENLNTIKFRDGEEILHAQSIDEWIYAAENQIPAWCENSNGTELLPEYGKLYNWYAVNNSRGLAPKGFRVATKDDWDQLHDFIGKNNASGLKILKDQVDQKTTNSKLNETGFSALKGGFRTDKHQFSEMGYIARWWTSSETNENEAIGYTIIDSELKTNSYYKYQGFSVRLIKE